MKNKNQRRALAQKKAKRKKIMIIAVGAAVVLAVAALIITNVYRQGHARVFTDGRQTLTLHSNGSFSARLYHNVMRSGTYTESVSDGVTTISFDESGVITQGRLAGNTLTFPDEWDDGHSHNRDLRLTV